MLGKMWVRQDVNQLVDKLWSNSGVKCVCILVVAVPVCRVWRLKIEWWLVLYHPRIGQ